MHLNEVHCEDVIWLHVDQVIQNNTNHPVYRRQYTKYEKYCLLGYGMV
jgi:hypothetical protein